MLKKFWNDEAGYVLSTEIVVLATILVIGVVTGVSSLRDSVVSELADVGQAFGSLDQSFSLRGSVACSSTTQSSAFFDSADFCDADDAASVQNSAGLFPSEGSPRTGEFQGRGVLPRQWVVKGSRRVNTQPRQGYRVYRRDVSPETVAQR